MMSPLACSKAPWASASPLLSEVVTIPPEPKVGSRAPEDSRQRSSSASRRGWREGGTPRAGLESRVVRGEKGHMDRVSFVGGGLRYQERAIAPGAQTERRG